MIKFIIFFLFSITLHAQFSEAEKKYNQGDYEGAIQDFLIEKRRFLSKNDYEKVAHLSWRIGWAYTDWGKRRESITELRSVIDLLHLRKRRVADSASLKLYSLLYQNYKMLYRADSSIIFSEFSDKLLEKNKNLQNLPNAFFYYRIRGYFADMEGNLNQSNAFFGQASRLISLLPSTEKSTAYNALGIHHQIAKNYDQAIAFFLKADDFSTDYSQKPNYLLSAAACTDDKNYAEQTKLIQKAELYYRKQKQIVPNYRDAKLEYNFALRRGRIFEIKHDVINAEKQYLRVVKICEEDFGGTHHWTMTIAFINLSKLFSQNNQLKKALSYAQDAIIVAHTNFKNHDTFTNPTEKGAVLNKFIFSALSQKASVAYQIFQSTKEKKYLELSIQTFQLATKIAKIVRLSYEGEISKLFFIDEFYPMLSMAIEAVYQDKNSINLCFDLQETSKASILSDVLVATRLKTKVLPDSLIRKENELDKSIIQKNITLISTKDSITKTQMLKQIDSLNLELELFREKIKKNYPKYYSTISNEKSITLNEIREKLIDNTTTFISYFISKSNLYIFTINRSKSGVYSQKIETNFIPKVQIFRNLLANSPQGKKYNAQALSAELYNILIKPIEKEIEGKKRLIIIRDAELNYLPFEVLAKQKDDFLLKKYIISYAYSASLLLPVKREQKQGSGLLGFAPFANNSFEQSLFRDKNLGQLPKSGSEIEKIGGDIYLENEATKKRFYEKYRDKNIIHFATHAITDDNDPLKSFIVFYPDGVDYKLFTNELYDLDLRNTSLVMLSACETGAGKLQKGEGVMSLSRAFTYAGAKAVITTLWNAHDEASAHISERFYKHLKDGLKTDEALQKAKLDFLNSDLALRYEHPYYWANFILIGPAETIDFGTNWWVWGFSIIFLLFLIFMVTRLRGKSISPKNAETRIG